MRLAVAIPLIVVSLTLGYFVGLYVRMGAPWSAGASIFAMITAVGAFGGLLYAVRDSGLELPHRDADKQHVIRLGWVADCAYGIAGAYVVFLILPTDLTGNGTAEDLLSSGSVLGLLKLLAVSVVGGYGGRSLVDRALANIAKDAEEAKKDAAEAKNKVVQIETVDTKARELVNRHIDKSEEVQDLQGMQDAVKAASRAARFEIFKEARAVRTANWNKDVPLMERTIPVFQALIDNNEKDKFHRNFGQLGYALKDQENPDWAGAYRTLDTAIALRKKAGDRGFLMYEFNRAVCAVKLGKDSSAIEGDLRAAARRKSLHEIIKKNDVIVAWAKENQFKLATLAEQSTGTA